jgi:hypothetical protein
MQSHGLFSICSVSSRPRLSLAAFVAILFSMVAGAFAQNPPPGMTGRNTPPEVLNGTAKVVKAYDPNQKLRLVFGLQPRNLDQEKQFLQELGTKGSPNFQHFLSPKEWNERFAPSKDDEQALVDWATQQGFTISKRWDNRLTVNVEAPISVIQNAFAVSIIQYQIGTTSYFSNDRDPQIPTAVSSILHSVQGLNNIQQLHPAIKGKTNQAFTNAYSPGDFSSKQPDLHHSGDRTRLPKQLASKLRNNKQPITNGYYDPTDIYSSDAYDYQALYNQGHCCNVFGLAASPPESSIAIATAGSFDFNDIAGFQAQYPYLAYNISQVYIGGTPACCNDETTLDVEWSLSMANSFGAYQNTSHVYAYEGVDAGLGTFTSIFQQMLNDGAARVMSTSWGCAEFYCYDTGTMDTQDYIFSQMIGQGWTLVAASDDQGATASCVATDIVEFPASDPNIVAAGGTTLYTSTSGFGSETGWQGGSGSGSCASNNGGSGGGFSDYYATPSYQTALGFGSRAVPDISLNASIGQNYYFAGGLYGVGGTSIVAPELAGFFAQENSYLDYVGEITGGCYGGGLCAPIGNGNWYIYWFGENPGYAPHYPFYDVLSGCNSNDITAEYGLGYYCAGGGYDEVTGWGSANMLQLAWAINTYRAADFGAPGANFSGPTTNHWYNTDQTVSWSLYDTETNGNPLTGVAGFSQAWDSDPGDVFSEPTPGVGNSFYSGPQFPNASTGYLQVSWAGQGCHTANLRAWDNSGFASGDLTYGPVCYDTVAPVTTATLSGTFSGGVYTSPVTVTLTATDGGSGVATTYYQINGGSTLAYTAPFKLTATGKKTVTFHSVDVAGNVENNEVINFTIQSPTTTSVVSSANPSSYGAQVTFTATVTPNFGGAALGTVTFKDGSSTLGTGSLSGGVATFTISTLAVGSHPITAVYGGSNADAGSTSGVLNQVVNPAGTTTTMTSSVNPAYFNETYTLTATVKSKTTGVPTGTVTFKIGTTTLGSGTLNGSGIATFTAKTMQVGTFPIIATYNGSGNYLTSKSSVLNLVVKKATTTTKVTSSLNPSKKGQAVTFTATITPAFGGSPAGTVTFKDGSTTLGTGSVNSAHQATFKTSSLAVGTHNITASYGGNADYVGSVSAVLKQVVNN